MRSFKGFLFLICALFVVPTLIKSEESLCTPSGIRLSLGDLYSTVSELDDLRLPSEISNDNQAYLVWQAQSHCDFLVQLSAVKNSEEQITKSVAFHTAYSHTFTGETHNETYHSTAYTVLLDELDYERSYQYEILDSLENRVAGPYTFKLTTPNITESPRKIFLAGDTDNTMKGNLTLDRIRSELARSSDNYAGWIHLGDVAYDLQNGNGKRGDNFFNSIQDITANLPFIMTPGNHDKFDHWKLLNFRLRNPLYNMTHNHYFSFNLQGIHFVTINFNYYNSGDTETQEKMLDWIEADLELANSEEHRALWPWVVVITHNPMYCQYNDLEGLESKKCYNYYGSMTVWDELFHEYSVDLSVSGHLHSYERMKPIYKNQSAAYDKEADDIDNSNIINPQATIYIVEGVGGTSGHYPKPYEASGYGLVANRDPGYGTLFTSKGPSGELVLTYEHYSSETGEVLDLMHITKKEVLADESDDSDDSSHFVLIAVAVAGFVGLIIAIIVLKKWRFGKIAEDKIPLNNSPLRSNKLRYNRPGEKGFAMVDL